MQDSEPDLTSSERQDFRRLAGIMVPPSTRHRVPGADDEIIFADIVRSLGRDRAQVQVALAKLREMAGSPFSALDDTKAETVAMALLESKGPATFALGRTVLQCYYRDDRVIRSLGLEPRAPFPKGNTLDSGDWSLLDPVRQRPRMWRDVDGRSS
jgi:hypothetical protein